MDTHDIQEALDYCLENPDGLSQQQLLDRYPEFRTELAGLLGTAGLVAGVEPPPIPANRRAAVKARLMSATSSSRLTSTTAPFSSEVPLETAPAPATLVSLSRKRRAAVRPLWALATAAALLIAFIWWGSATALADSPLYGIKLAYQDFMLNLDASPAGKALGHIRFAGERLYDFRAMQSADKIDAAGPAIRAYADHMQAAGDIWKKLEGQERTKVAELLYTTGLAGQANFGAASTIPSVSASTRETLISAHAEAEAAGALVQDALHEANISLPAAIAEAGTTIPSVTALLTPLPLSDDSAPPTTTPGGAGGTGSLGPSSDPAAPEGTRTASGAPTSPGGLLQPATNTTTATATEPAGTPTQAASTSTAISEPTASSPRATPSPPRATPSPPRATPVPPGPYDTRTPEPTTTKNPKPDDTATAEPSLTLTPEYTATSLASATVTGTVEATAGPSGTPTVPEPTATHTPNPNAVSCDLHIIQVAMSCGAEDCIDWTASVENRGAVAVTAGWRAELQVHRPGGGGFQTVATAYGTGTLEPGVNDLSGSLCSTALRDATGIRVVVFVTAQGCAEISRQDQMNDLCGTGGQPTETAVPEPTVEPTPLGTVEPEPTPGGPPGQTPEPSRTPRPSSTPRPTSTPRETVPLPTVVPLPTSIPLPTLVLP